MATASRVSTEHHQADSASSRQHHAAEQQTQASSLDVTDPFALARLQRSLGNQAVQRLVARGLVQRHNAPTVANPAGGLFSRLFGGSAAKTDAQKKRAQIDSVLNKSAPGKAALKVIEDYKVPVDLEHPGPGSVYQGPAPGKILIETALGADEAAFVLVHEAQHAKASNLGGTADVTAMSKADYVKTMINEETDATVNAILAMRGMSKGAQKKLTATPVMAERYDTAYNAAYKAATDAKKKAAEAKADADKAGWKSINDAFYDGSLVTSNTGETYAVYYGSFWESVNNPPPPPPPPTPDATPPAEETPPAPPTGG